MAAIDAACKNPVDAGHVRFVTRLAGEEIGHLPFERQGDECLRFTPTPLRNLSQHRFEPLLAEAAEKNPRADLRYRWQWEGSEQDADGATVWNLGFRKTSSMPLLSLRLLFGGTQSRITIRVPRLVSSNSAAALSTRWPRPVA